MLIKKIKILKATGLSIILKRVSNISDIYPCKKCILYNVPDCKIKTPLLNKSMLLDNYCDRYDTTTYTHIIDAIKKA